MAALLEMAKEFGENMIKQVTGNTEPVKTESGLGTGTELRQEPVTVLGTAGNESEHGTELPVTELPVTGNGTEPATGGGKKRKHTRRSRKRKLTRNRRRHVRSTRRKLSKRSK
jgi:hypothetical protein